MYMTHGYELKGGMQGTWDKFNSIINKIYILKEVQIGSYRIVTGKRLAAWGMVSR